MRVAAQPGFRMDICDCPLASPAQAQGLNKRAESGEWRKESGGRWTESAESLPLSFSAALSAAYTPHWVVVVLSAGLLLTFCLPCAPL